MAAQSNAFPDITGIILAGGLSSRLGRDKAFETIKNRRLIDLVSAVLGKVCRDEIIITSAERYHSFIDAGLSPAVIIDELPGKSSIGGVYTGIRYMKTYYCIVVACDMPFINEALLKYMLSISDGYEAVVPRLDGVLQTLHAVYSKSCLNALKTSIDSGRLSLWRVLKCVNTRFIEEEEYSRFDHGKLSFFNINAPADLVKAECLADQIEAGFIKNTETGMVQGSE